MDDEEGRVGSVLTGWLPGRDLDVNKDGFIKGEVAGLLTALVPGLAGVLLVGEVVGRSETAVWSSQGVAESPLGEVEFFFPGAGVVCISEEVPVALGRLIMMGVDFLVSVFSPSGGVRVGVEDLDLEDW